MPTISTYSAALPFGSGYQTGVNAQQIYNDEKLRQQAKEQADNDYRNQVFEEQKRDNELNYMMKLSDMAKEKLAVEREANVNAINAGMKYASDYDLPFDLNNPEINNVVTQVRDAHFSKIPSIQQQSIQGQGIQPQGGGQQPSNAIDNQQKPLKLNRKMKQDLYQKAYEVNKLGVKVNLSDIMNSPDYDTAMAKLNDAVNQRVTQEDKKTERVVRERVARELPKMNKEVQSSMAVARLIDQLEKKIGFNLEDYSPNKDVPGKTIFGKRITGWGKAQEIQNIAQGIYNAKLYDSSGAQINETEMRRILNEMGASGLFQTEETMMEALKRYKENLYLKINSIQDSYSPETLEIAEKRGLIKVPRLEEQETQQGTTQSSNEPVIVARRPVNA